MSIGLFFGSFNPVHKVHIKICRIIFHNRKFNLKSIWLIPSPQSPFKKKDNLMPIEDRLNMLNLVIKKQKKIKKFLKINQIELALSQPNYTYRTLEVLQKKYPSVNFKIILGEDNLISLYQWKKASWIMKAFPLIVFPRTIDKLNKLDSFNFNNRSKLNLNKKNIFFIQEKNIDLSSSEVREKIKSFQNPKKQILVNHDLKKKLYSSTISYLANNVIVNE